MGFNCSLVAIPGHSPDRVHDALGLAPTGAIEAFPESSIASAHTMDGGTLLWIGLLSHDTQWSPDPDILRALSVGSRVAICDVMERTMYSAARLWVDGAVAWSAVHDCNQSPTHFEITGTPPDDLPEILSRVLANQAENPDVDFVFDVPVELFVSAGGRRYDDDFETRGPSPWQVLDPIER